MAKKIKQEIYYDEKSDALWLKIGGGTEVESKETIPGINLEIGKNNKLLGIEILNASKILGNKLRPDKTKQTFPVVTT